MAKSLSDLRSTANTVLVDAGSSAPSTPLPIPPACQSSFREETRRIFVDVVQKHFIASGQKPAPRPVFRKAHGVAEGTLRINQDIPDRYRHGLLAQHELRPGFDFRATRRPTRLTAPTPYCDRQWVCKYTYDGIYDRLVAEDAQFARAEKQRS